MSGWTRLGLGQWITFEEQRHQVAGFTDTGVRLRAESGRSQIILLGALLGDPSFHADPTDPAPEPSVKDTTTTGLVVDRDAVLLGLPEAERTRVAELEAHLQDIVLSTGKHLFPDSAVVTTTYR